MLANNRYAKSVNGLLSRRSVESSHENMKEKGGLITIEHTTMDWCERWRNSEPMVESRLDSR